MLRAVAPSNTRGLCSVSSGELALVRPCSGDPQHDVHRDGPVSEPSTIGLPRDEQRTRRSFVRASAFGDVNVVKLRARRWAASGNARSPTLSSTVRITERPTEITSHCTVPDSRRSRNARPAIMSAHQHARVPVTTGPPRCDWGSNPTPSLPERRVMTKSPGGDPELAPREGLFDQRASGRPRSSVRRWESGSSRRLSSNPAIDHEFARARGIVSACQSAGTIR